MKPREYYALRDLEIARRHIARSSTDYIGPEASEGEKRIMAKINEALGCAQDAYLMIEEFAKPTPNTLRGEEL